MDRWRRRAVAGVPRCGHAAAGCAAARAGAAAPAGSPELVSGSGLPARPAAPDVAGTPLPGPARGAAPEAPDRTATRATAVESRLATAHAPGTQAARPRAMAHNPLARHRPA